MTIYLYSGTPGSGKSVDAGRQLRYDLSRRTPRPVIANFDINKDEVRHPELFHYVPNHELTADYLIDFADRWWTNYPDFHEDFIKIYLDEAQLCWNARTWASRDRLSMLSLLSQHRKHGMQVVMIAQSPKMIDNQFRMLIEYEVIHRKVSNLGLIGGILGTLTFGRLFVKVTTYYSMAERVSSEWFMVRKRDFRIYDSYAKFQGTDNS